MSSPKLSTLPPAGDARPKLTVTRRRAVLIAVLVALVGFAWTVDRWLLHPPQAEFPLTASDAIFVHAGGQGERLDRALELIEAGVSSNLVLSPAFRNGESSPISEWGGQPAIVALCEDPPNGLNVVCLPLTERNTRGEARAFGNYAKEMGWDSITLVSNTHHLHRATVRLSRCFEGEILPVEAPTQPDGSFYEFYVHEYFGNLEAYLLQRGC